MATMKVPDVARDLIVRALDALSDRMATAEGETPSPVQRLAGSWRSLTATERDEVANYIGTAAEGLAAAVPIAIVATRKRIRRRRTQRAAARANAPALAAASDKPAEKKDKKKDRKKKNKKGKKSKKDKKKRKDRKKDKKGKKK